MLEAVFKNGFDHDAAALGHGEHGGHGLLEIGGETGVFLGLYVHGPVAADHVHPDGVVGLGHGNAHLKQLRGEAFHMGRDAAR